MQTNSRKWDKIPQIKKNSYTKISMVVSTATLFDHTSNGNMLVKTQ